MFTSPVHSHVFDGKSRATSRRRSNDFNVIFMQIAHENRIKRFVLFRFHKKRASMAAVLGSEDALARGQSCKENKMHNINANQNEANLDKKAQNCRQQTAAVGVPCAKRHSVYGTESGSGAS